MYGFYPYESDIELDQKARCVCAEIVAHKHFKRLRKHKPDVFNLVLSDCYIAALKATVNPQKFICEQVAYIKQACLWHVSNRFRAKGDTQGLKTQVREQNFSSYNKNAKEQDFSLCILSTYRDSIKSYDDAEAFSVHWRDLMLFVKTEREIRVLNLLSEGYSKTEIAKLLHLKDVNNVVWICDQIRKRILLNPPQWLMWHVDAFLKRKSLRNNKKHIIRSQ